ncbi:MULTISPECIES: HAD-IA family hydrolase [Methylobacterium]|jgi:phosphoglycolate phosphatase|uniref:Imidazoleglycerol-phosphate dehydratase n=3 Tax=Methylobacterium TaxID=407 RepID=A0AAE8HRX6_9HYPH|nr:MULTISPECIES: HAD-IA family hydrolase [Methylobacterium]KOX43681.1 HAD family hydrolase [Streptomyces purpurogeneiscleroticus]AIQ88822.1 HAD-superfamily hydrolase [Methylobacterium oryzae CBMB20]APT29742.1 imidazoleglycerol-phosphate dehydratase [Methylobacterium phyllosphaerae]AWV18603.1 HAD family hydrolase [Methylobacterium sp. XJLW]MBA9062642.1 phosphoglycolate phosphatase [Methylobacterium fujisawaense]
MRLVVFDVDGTLVDSQHLIVAAQEVAFAENGLPAPGRREALSVVGLSLPQAFRRLVGEDGPVAELSESYKQAYNRLRLDPAHEEPLFPGMADLLTRLHDRGDVLIGLATGKSRRGVDRLIAHHGWAEWFATTQSADDAPSKPDPTMLRQAISEAGCAPEATVMVGDTTFDIAMGVAAGATAIGVAWGYHPPDALYGAGAVTVVPTAAALEVLLLEGLATGG